MTKLILILILFNFKCFAQTSKDSIRLQFIKEREIRQQKIKENVRKDLISEIEKHTRELKLTSLKRSIKKVHLRIWTAKQCFEIQISGKNKIVGVLTNYVVTTKSEKVKTSNKIGIAIGKSVPLDSIITNNIYNSFLEQSIESIPSMDQIPSWGYGQDGHVLIIEQMIKGKYKLKFYWSPKHESEIDFSKQIAIFEENFYSEELDEIHKIFFKKLPIGCYYYGGEIIHCRTKK